MPTQKGQTNRTHPLNLVELLVVLAILALLLSFLISSLSRVTENSFRLQCTNNLRQIGIIFDLYTENNKYQHPEGFADPWNGRPYYALWYEFLYGDGLLEITTLNTFTKGNFNANTLPSLVCPSGGNGQNYNLYPHYAEFGRFFWYRPVHSPLIPNNSFQGDAPYYQGSINLSYSVNYRLGTKLVTKLRDPTKSVRILDKYVYISVEKLDQLTGREQFYQRHSHDRSVNNGLLNVLFFDSHVGSTYPWQASDSNSPWRRGNSIHWQP